MNIDEKRVFNTYEGHVFGKQCLYYDVWHVRLEISTLAFWSNYHFDDCKNRVYGV